MVLDWLTLGMEGLERTNIQVEASAYANLGLAKLKYVNNYVDTEVLVVGFEVR